MSFLANQQAAQMPIGGFPFPQDVMHKTYERELRPPLYILDILLFLNIYAASLSTELFTHTVNSSFVHFEISSMDFATFL